jgi:hypothetical protein
MAGCDKEEGKKEIQLQGTKWKLVGYSVIGEKLLRALEPQDCEECYTLAFETNNMGYAISVANTIAIDLSEKPFFGGRTKIYDDNIGDAALFYEITSLIESYSVSEDKLYFYWNEGKNYVLYKLQKS